MRSIKEIFLTLTFAFALFSLTAQTDPPDPNGGNDPTTNNNTPVGGNATVSGGMFILLGLGMVFGGCKAYKLIKD